LSPHLNIASRRQKEEEKREEVARLREEEASRQRERELDREMEEEERQRMKDELKTKREEEWTYQGLNEDANALLEEKSASPINALAVGTALPSTSPQSERSPGSRSLSPSGLAPVIVSTLEKAMLKRAGLNSKASPLRKRGESRSTSPKAARAHRSSDKAQRSQSALGEASHGNDAASHGNDNAKDRGGEEVSDDASRPPSSGTKSRNSRRERRGRYNPDLEAAMFARAESQWK